MNRKNEYLLDSQWLTAIGFWIDKFELLTSLLQSVSINTMVLAECVFFHAFHLGNLIRQLWKYDLRTWSLFKSIQNKYAVIQVLKLAMKPPHLVLWTAKNSLYGTACQRQAHLLDLGIAPDRLEFDTVETSFHCQVIFLISETGPTAFIIHKLISRPISVKHLPYPTALSWRDETFQHDWSET